MPEPLLNQSLVMKKLAASPRQLAANNRTANHHAHVFRWSKPMAAAQVPIPRASSITPDMRPIARKAASPGRFSAQSRSMSGLGTRRDVPVKSAMPVANNRKIAKTGMTLGLRAITAPP